MLQALEDLQILDVSVLLSVNWQIQKLLWFPTLNLAFLVCACFPIVDITLHFHLINHLNHIRDFHGYHAMSIDFLLPTTINQAVWVQIGLSVTYIRCKVQARLFFFLLFSEFWIKIIILLMFSHVFMCFYKRDLLL